ncbi:MAG: hypothetical protein CMC48_07480, partial [Flavobacteriaceae bacterium]|nr:hypothetical protein [Flavobacteriaceae bacterium]
MLPEKLTNKKNFLFVISIFFLIAVFIFKNLSIKFEKKEYIGVFFKRPFPLIVINPSENLVDSGSFLISIENETNTNSFFSKLESRTGSIEGKMIKVSGELTTGDGTSFVEISNKQELLSVLQKQNTYPSEQTKTKKIVLKGMIIDLKCVIKNDFSRDCFYKNLYKGSIPALRIYRNKENINYLLKIKDYEIIDDYLKNNFKKTVKVFGEYYYQNGFNV